MPRLRRGHIHTWTARAGLLTLTWVGLTAILIAAGEGVVQSSTLTTFDHNVTSFVVGHRTPAVNDAMKAVTWIGSWLTLLVTTAVTLILTARRRLPLIAVPFVLVAWAGELAAVTLAKHVGRQRPPKDLWLVTAHGQSFPSGHTANALVVCVACAVLVSSSVRAAPAKALTWPTAILAILTVGFSRIELGVHWTTDVLASAVFVSVWMGIIGASLRPPTVVLTTDRNALQMSVAAPGSSDESGSRTFRMKLGAVSAS